MPSITRLAAKYGPNDAQSADASCYRPQATMRSSSGLLTMCHFAFSADSQARNKVVRKLPGVESDSLSLDCNIRCEEAVHYTLS